MAEGYFLPPVDKKLRRAQLKFQDHTNKNWANDKNKFGFKLMKQMGWEEGKGLGQDGQGMSENLKIKVNFDNKGLGDDEDFQRDWADAVDSYQNVLAKLQSANPPSQNIDEKKDRKEKKDKKEKKGKKEKKDKKRKAEDEGESKKKSKKPKFDLVANQRPQRVGRSKRISTKDFSKEELNILIVRESKKIKSEKSEKPDITSSPEPNEVESKKKDKKKEKKDKKSKKAKKQDKKDASDSDKENAEDENYGEKSVILFEKKMKEKLDGNETLLSHALSMRFQRSSTLLDGSEIL